MCSRWFSLMCLVKSVPEGSVLCVSDVSVWCLPYSSVYVFQMPSRMADIMLKLKITQT